uniref:Uncharacterized protein n=1 Tax=Amphimedon queenslandica TaxID=400682 RepID=A0A1X7VPG6_AMPQE
MSWSEEAVGRHIAAIKSRAKSKEELKLQGYTLAQLCLKAKLYSPAIGYLSEYLSMKSDDYKAHKLLGEVYKCKDETERALVAYKRSLYFKKDQPDVVISIGELYCERDDVSENELKEWIEHVKKYHQNHPVIAKLKGKLVANSNNAGDELVLEIIGGMEEGSEDPLVLMKLAERFLDQGCLNESYGLFKRFRYNKTNRNKVELMRLFMDYLEKLLGLLSTDKGLLILYVSISLLETIIEIFNIEMMNEHKHKTTGQKLIQYLIKYDHILYKVLSLSSTADVRKLLTQAMEEVLGELQSHCYFLLSQYFFSFCSPNKFELGVACLLATLKTPPLNIELFNELPQSQYDEMDRWYHKGGARLSTAGE